MPNVAKEEKKNYGDEHAFPKINFLDPTSLSAFTYIRKIFYKFWRVEKVIFESIIASYFIQMFIITILIEQNYKFIKDKYCIVLLFSMLMTCGTYWLMFMKIVQLSYKGNKFFDHFNMEYQYLKLKITNLLQNFDHYFITLGSNRKIPEVSHDKLINEIIKVINIKCKKEKNSLQIYQKKLEIERENLEQISRLIDMHMEDV